MHLLGLLWNTINQSITSQFHHTNFPSSQAQTWFLSQSKCSGGGGGDNVDGTCGECGAGGEYGVGEGGVDVGDGGGGGVGGGGPSTLRVWKDGTPCLATVVTFRLPEAGGGEGWSWRGRGGSGSGGGGIAREAW